MVKLGTTRDGWRRYYCVVCGHVEWVAPGEELGADYHCPLCGEGRSVMLALDDERLARHRVEFKQAAESVWQVDKRPPFRDDFQHYSYILAHPEGVILYDAPPVVTDEAIEAILAIGRPRLLIVSHTDFVGFAGDWADALGIPALMGEGDEPLAGNRFEPDERVSAPRKISDDLEIVPVPGHSPGSLAVYWSGAADGAVLCCGDALAIWPHDDGRTQVSFFQDAPVDQEIESLIARPVRLLAACGGRITNADGVLKQLRETENNCARPWKGETGGVWVR
jgi:glyoxylase-like metal-dependent hydrolase (beta-lactamase superfamily II)